MKQLSHLERIIGKIVTDTEMGSSISYAINDPNNTRTEIELSISFEDYYLNIYNPINLIPSDKELMDFIGLKVITISETKEQAELIFDNGYRLIIDLREEVYYGPEAMSLTGPDNFCAVWN